MTSDEISKKQASDLNTDSWLREIALQLALLNERQEPKQPEVRKPAKAVR